MARKMAALLLAAVLAASAVAGCGNSSGTGAPAESPAEGAQEQEGAEAPAQEGQDTNVAAKAGDSATGKTDLADAGFDTSYEPQKDSYEIYCTYKNIHSWYDAIQCGIDAAVEDLAGKGVTVKYEWYGPAEPDAVDQVNSIETARGQGYDLIAVDVN